MIKSNGIALNKHFCFLLLFLLLFIWSTDSVLAKTRSKRSTVSRTLTQKKKKRKSSTVRRRQRRRTYAYRLNAALGVDIVGGESGVLVGGQFGFALGEDKLFYIGPDISFTKFSDGSLINVLLSGWYHLRLKGAPRLGIEGGIAVGAAFPSNVQRVSNTSLALFLDAVIVQQVNDFFSVRGQFRPGVIGENFAYMMSFNIAFRFE